MPKQNLLPNEKTSEDGGECKNEPEGNNDLLKTKCEDEHHTDVDEGSCIKYVTFSLIFHPTQVVSLSLIILGQLYKTFNHLLITIL